MVTEQPDNAAEKRKRLRAAIFEAAQQQRDAKVGDTMVLGQLPPNPRFWGQIAIVMFAAYWAESDNPVFIWNAYQKCREHGIPLPGWVTDYLDSTARNISSISPSPRKTRKTRSAAQGEVYRALGFAKSGSIDPFGQAKLREKTVQAVRRVSELKDVPKTGSSGGGVTGAFHVVGLELNKGHKTIEKWYYRWKPILEQPVPRGIFETDPSS